MGLIISESDKVLDRKLCFLADVLAKGIDVFVGWLALVELLQAFVEQGLDPCPVTFDLAVERNHKFSLLVVGEDI